MYTTLYVGQWKKKSEQLTTSFILNTELSQIVNAASSQLLNYQNLKY